MAMGAQQRHVLKLIVGQGLRLVLVGVAIGLAVALAATRVLSNLLFGVTATDPPIFVAVPLLLVAVAILASYVPARKAVRVDPINALRNE
jgi:putative ABC transport system permease protein